MSLSKQSRLGCELTDLDEERQDSRQKRQRVDEHARQDAAKNRLENGGGGGGPGGMQMNGTDYVAINPAATARGGDLHPSLPSRPAFDIVPKEEPVKKLTPAQRKELEAENMKRGVANMDAGSSVDVVRNRRAIRMANMSAADKLRAEMNGETVGGEDEGDDTVTLERKDEEEKEQLEPGQARGVLEDQAEDEGVDEDVVEPPVGTDEDEGEAAVPLEGEETMDDDDEEDDDEGDVAVPAEGNPKPKLTKAEKKAAKAARRGLKRKAEEVIEDDVEEEEEDDTEAPPNPEADQPASKKKLKINADGTVDGY